MEGYLHGPNGERTWRSLNPYAGILGGGPHPYDTLRWLTGAAFTEVSAYGTSRPPGRWIATPTTFRWRCSKRPAAPWLRGQGGGLQRAGAASYCLYLSLYGTKGTWERNRLQAPGADTSEDYLFLRKIPNLREMVKLSRPARATTISPG